MEAGRIILSSFGNFEKGLLEKLVLDVTNEYQRPVSVEENHYDLNPCYNPERRQYEGNMLLNHISISAPPDPVRTVGLFRIDLFIPVLTYIFGQAMLNGTSAIASLYRLRNELYGLKKDEALMIERFSKEVIHELGHTFGLIHCQFSSCVMRSSTYVEDIDQKSIHLCGRCKAEAVLQK